MLQSYEKLFYGRNSSLMTTTFPIYFFEDTLVYNKAHNYSIVKNLLMNSRHQEKP